MPKLLKKQEEGFNRDLEITKKEWKEEKKKTNTTKRSLGAVLNLDEKTYRDDKKEKSIELKDYRHKKYEADFVAELEHYNPEKAPIRHILIDFPTWLWKNRIKNKGPKTR